jgi:GNAT superfamily N-acetyltransferase
MFSKYHYLDAKHNNAAHVYVSYVNDIICGFISVLPQPGATKNLFRVHRLVVLPDYQGIGVGLRMLNDVAKLYKSNNKEICIVTSSPSLLAALNKNNDWRCSKFGRSKSGNFGNSLTLKRISASFRYK